MPQRTGVLQPCRIDRVLVLAAAIMVATTMKSPSRAAAQDAGQTGSVSGRVVDEQGAGINGAQVYLIRPALSAQTGTDGRYVLSRVPGGTHVVYVRMLGFRPDSATVAVSPGQQATQNFTLGRDPLQLQTTVVTGTTTPRQNLAASVAVTTLTAEEVRQAQPRSTTEMLRYVPGFTPRTTTSTSGLATRSRTRGSGSTWIC